MALRVDRARNGGEGLAWLCGRVQHPFAASLFVLETMAGIAAPELLLPVMAATVGAASITRATVGAGPIYGQRAFGLESYA